MGNSDLFFELKKLLDAFDDVCKRNGLKYTLFAGTLLGSIRHKGFIPWDDDLDVAMMREDYDKLLSLPSTEFSYPYFLQTPKTDNGYHKAFAKLRNSSTTEIPYKDAIFNYNHGVFIDIFPYDKVPEDEAVFNKLIHELNSAKRMLHWTGRIDGKVGTKGLDLKRKLFYYAIYPLVKMKVITPQKAFEKVNKIASRFNDTNSSRIGTIVFSEKNERFIYELADFKETISHEFESDRYPIPYHFDNVLTKCYGDYMTPVRQRSEHGETVVDVNIPYVEYIDAHKDELFSLYMNSR